MPLLDDVRPDQRSAWGREVVRLTHRLADSELFTEDALAGLLDRAEEGMLGIRTTGPHCPDPARWYGCTRGHVDGAGLLAAVARGRLWINLSGVDASEPALARVLTGLYEELQEQVPGFRTSRRRLGLLISSPYADVGYHADPLGQGLVQVRGAKRIWLYPARPPYLPTPALEDIVRGVTGEDLPYDPTFDEAATVLDLEPGDLLHWPLNAPHRVSNHDSLNVSLTTEYWTTDVRRHYLMNYGNGLLRKRGRQPRVRSVSGPAFWAKTALAVTDRLRRGGGAAPPRAPSFAVDPSSPTGTRPVQQVRAQPDRSGRPG